ncbi:MAG: hypothetical protein AMK71_11475 [Nitrospira bacterium SG8_35_4]|nr:MAG: hypothetical protein AMK71_11475 [Nitrospira bacterium SG8_35_4]
MGFFYPDPLFPNNEIDSRNIIYLIKYAIYSAVAIALITVPIIYYQVISKCIRLKNILFISIIILFFSLLLYVPVSFIYEKSMMPRGKFHPYLQLYPPQIPDDISEDEFLIVCLGGSTTGWSDEKKQKWPSKVEANLNKLLPEYKIRVLNQGKAWYTSQHSLINYELNIRSLKPDLVIIMHAINDFMNNADHSYYSNGTFRGDYGHYMGALTRLYRIRPLLIKIKDTFNSIWYWEKRNEIETDLFPGLISLDKNLRRLIQLIRLDGSSAILLTQPFLYKENMNREERSSVWMNATNGVGSDKKWSISTARNGMIQYNHAIRKIASHVGVPLVDIESKVPKTLEYFKDDCHYKSPAINIISEELTKTILEIISLKK